MKDYKVGGRGHSSGGSIFPALLAALAGAPGGNKSGNAQAKPNTDNTQTTPAYDDSGNVIGNQNNATTPNQNGSTLAKPSLLQSILNPSLLNTYYQNQGVSAVSSQESQQIIQQKTAEAALQANKDFRGQAIAIAQTSGVPIANEQDLASFTAATFHPSVLNAVAQKGVQATQLGTAQATAGAQRNMAESSTGQEAAGQNYLANENEQGVRNEEMIPDTGPFGLRYGNLGPGMGTLNVTGFQPGSASTKQSTFTMKNGLPVQTETSTATPTVSGGMGEITPNLSQADLDSMHNSFLENNQTPTNQTSPPTNPPITSAKPFSDSSLGPVLPFNSFLSPPNMSPPVAAKPQATDAITQLLQYMQQQKNQAQGAGIVNPLGNVPPQLQQLFGTQQ